MFPDVSKIAQQLARGARAWLDATHRGGRRLTRLSFLPRNETTGDAAPPRSLRRSLVAMFAEGAVAEVFAACATGAVTTAWALHLGASPPVVGLVSALPVAAQVVNVPVTWLTHGVSRKRLTVAAIAGARLVYAPLALFPFLGIAPEAKLQAFLVIVAISTLCGVTGNNAWTAWIGDLVPRRIRGRFFGRRTAYTSAAGALASLAVAVALDRVAAQAATAVVLAAVTAIGCAVGLISVGLLRRQAESSEADHPPPVATSAFGQVLRDPHARPFLSYQFAWNAAVAISASFFSFHLLVNLKTGFAIVAAHGLAAATVRSVSASVWGRAVDRVGARPVLVFTSFGISLVPTIWFFATPDFLWPIAVEACLAGFLWAGHGIAGAGLTISLSPREVRPCYLAVFAMAGGLGFAVSAIAAGQLAGAVPTQFALGGQALSNMHVLFALSAVARALAAVLATRVHDPQERGGVADLFRALGDAAPRRRLRQSSAEA